MSDPTAPYDQDLPDDEVADVVGENQMASPVGLLVKVTHEDPRNPGQEVVQFGTVVEHVDDGVVVALFPAVVGPLPLDHTCHERLDAPRVEFLDTSEVTDAGAFLRALTGA